MSPSVVDLQSPAPSSSFSSKAQSSLNRSQSFVAGSIYSSSSHFIFGSSSIPDRFSSMDGGNLGHGVSAPLEKVLVSRFRKQRKRGGASRSVASRAGEDCGAQVLQQKMYGWKPFESDVVNSSSCGTGFVFGAGSSGSNAGLSDVGDGGRGDIGKGVFGFGSEMEKDLRWESSASLSTSTGNFCNVGFAKFQSVRTGMPVGEGNVVSDEGVFVFGSSGNLCNGSSFGSDNDSFGALNSSKNVDAKSGKPESSFVSADGLFNEKHVRISKKDQKIFGNVDCKKAGRGLYVFGRSAETKFNLDQKSNICSNGSSFSSKLPEDLMKLKIDTSEMSENENKDPGVFVFGSGVNNSSCANKSTSFEFIGSSVSKLPQKMEKLNIHSSVGEVHGNNESNFKKHAQFGQTSASGDDVGISMFPGELKKQNLHSSGNEEHGNDNHGVFIFGSDVKKNANSGKAAALNFEKSSFSKLPDEMKNMKLNSSGNEDDSQKTKPGHTWNKQGNNGASNFTPQTSTEHFGSKVTPLQTHNSCGLSAEPTSFPSASPSFQTSVNHLYFTSMNTGSETPMEFKSQKEDASLLTKENLFTKAHENMIFSMKKEDSKAVRLKSRRGKSKKSTPIHTGIAKQFVSVDNGPEENQVQDFTGGDSPMDYSPYQETLVTNQCSREMPVATAESIYFDSRCSPNDAEISGFVDSKEGESAAEHFDCCFRVPSGRQFTSVDEMTSGVQKGSIEAANENVESVIQAKYSSIESESFNSDSSIKQPTYEGEFAINSCPPDAGQYNFLFTATSSVQDPSSASRRNYRKKSNIKGVRESQTKFKQPSPPSNVFPSPAPIDPKPEQKGSDLGIKVGQVNAVKSDQESAEEACEKWRLRGNHSYADGNLLKAEGYYSRGVDSFSFNEVPRSRSKALMLCYSNRAAARMSLKRMREALDDCMMAVAIDPSFLRARVRAGNIHLSLGEFTDALQHFENVLHLDKEEKSDQKILFEAADGIEKIQKLNDLMDQSSIFLAKRTLDDATKALEIISEALSIAPHSENLLEMKAEALVKLRNFDEAIQICEQTLEFAEKNAIVTKSDSQSKGTDCSKSMEISHSRFWRWRIIAKSYFYLGKLEEANELLQKHEKVKPVIDKYWNRYPESSASFSVTVCELLRLKAAGNEAFQAGKHLEAVELYTAALALNTESRPFTAICFCNRAAAYQALGQVTDAIADCSLAIALDSSYKKAISRRATLHEMIRDHDQATNDLRRLISLLEMSSEDKNSLSGGALARSSSNITELNQARTRFSVVEEEARKVGTLDMYKILGIERSCSATDVKKAYRKAALRHHPDKAGQFLARSENGDDSVWREIAEEVHSDADRLFKMIGEAYAILVDPSKRLQYDTEEELRTKKKSYGPYSSPHERSSNPRQWSSYGTSRWKG